MPPRIRPRVQAEARAVDARRGERRPAAQPARDRDLRVEAGRGERRARARRAGASIAPALTAAPPRRPAPPARATPRLARIEDQQPVVGEQRRQHAGEGGRQRPARDVVRAQQGQRLVAAAPADRAARRARRAGRPRPARARGARSRRAPSPAARRASAQPDRLAVGPRDGRRRDLGEVVILRLQPEQRHAAHAGLGRQRARDRDRRRRLVEAVERPEEQARPAGRSRRPRVPPPASASRFRARARRWRAAPPAARAAPRRSAGSARRPAAARVAAPRGPRASGSRAGGTPRAVASPARYELENARATEGINYTRPVAHRRCPSAACDRPCRLSTPSPV